MICVPLSRISRGIGPHLSSHSTVSSHYVRNLHLSQFGPSFASVAFAKSGIPYQTKWTSATTRRHPFYFEQPSAPLVILHCCVYLFESLCQPMADPYVEFLQLGGRQVGTYFFYVATFVNIVSCALLLGSALARTFYRCQTRYADVSRVGPVVKNALQRFDDKKTGCDIASRYCT